MAPDVLEADQLTSGRRQEGAYAGVSVFVDKRYAEIRRRLVL